MAKLIGIATHSESKGLITQHSEIKVSLESGLKNDFQGQLNSKYAVTLLSQKSWQLACADIHAEIDWTERRANLLVDDLDFSEELLDEQIQIGEVLLEITAECDPCKRMEEVEDGLKKALSADWRGGVRCRVLRKGKIKIGDSVTVLKRF